MVEVKRKENESFESLLRRFNRKVQQSGVVIRTRKARFRVEEKSRNMKRRAAKRRSEMTALRDEAKKRGLVFNPKK